MKGREVAGLCCRQGAWLLALLLVIAAHFKPFFIFKCTRSYVYTHRVSLAFYLSLILSTCLFIRLDFSDLFDMVLHCLFF